MEKAMQLRKIAPEQFDNFVFKHPQGHFMQTSSWGLVCAKRNQKAYLTGLFDGEELKGTALLLEKKILNYTYYYCPRGFVLDYEDKETLKQMIAEVKSFAKQHNALYFKIDPALIIHKLDQKAEVIFEDEKNLQLIETLKSLGGTHKGFTKRFADSSNPRYTFRLKVDEDAEVLFNQFHPTTRNILKRNNPYDVKIVKGDKNDLKAFYDTMIETCHRKGIVLEPYEFFEDFYTILNQNGMSDLYLAKIDLKNLKVKYAAKASELQKAIEDAQSPAATSRQKKRLNDLNDQLKKNQKESAELNKLTGDEIVLSGVITAKYKDMVWIVHGGNGDRLKFVNANYELYYHIIRDAADMGYQWVDFFGGEGTLDPTSSLYGITLFKLRFGGDYDEFIGEFDFILKPLTNKIIMTLLKARRKYLIRKAKKHENH